MEKGFIMSLIFAAIIAIFALANGEKVSIDLLLTKVEISQAIVIFISTLFGAVIVALLSTFETLKLRKEIRELRKAKEELEKTLDKIGESDVGDSRGSSKNFSLDENNHNLQNDIGED